MTTRPAPRSVPTPRPPAEPSGGSLGSRLRATAVALVALTVVGALAVAAVSVSGASTGRAPDDPHVDHAAMGAPLADDDIPPPPGPGQMVGVLDLFGQPLRGPDGQPLSVPLRPPAPRLPANAGEVLPPGGAPPTEGSVEVDLLSAHAGTLNAVANDEGYDLVERFDLFRNNGLVTAVAGQPDSDSAYRALLVTLQQQVDSDDPVSGCPTAATALAQSDGTPTDLVAGPGAAQLHAEVVATRAAVGCP